MDATRCLKANFAKKFSLWRILMLFALFCMSITKVIWIWPPKKTALSLKIVHFLVKVDAEALWNGQKQYNMTFRWLFISLFRQKGYNTWCSQAVSHPSTNQALRCLTSVIGRELMLSTWYGRSHWHLNENWFFWQHSFIQHRFTHLAKYFQFFRCILMMFFPTEHYLSRKLEP